MKVDVNSVFQTKIDKLNAKVLVTETTLQVYEWLIDILGFEYTHSDVRGGDSYTIILNTELSNFDKINQKVLEQSFRNQAFYRAAKENLITVGYAKNTSNNKLYLYVQCSYDLLERSENISSIKGVVLARTNKELFNHVDKYFE